MAYIIATILLAGDCDPDDREYELPAGPLLELIKGGVDNINAQLNLYAKEPASLVEARDAGCDIEAWLREKLENPQ